MRRRQFLAFLGSATLAGSLAARAQQDQHRRRIGVLNSMAADDLDAQTRYAAFIQALRQFGWTEDQNIRIDIRWSAGDPNRARKYAAEIVALGPDVILAIGSLSLAPLLEATRTIPLVFAIVADPVGGGFVDSLSRPGGNATGFMMYEYSLSGKWPELLKRIAPDVTRAAVLRDAAFSPAIGQLAVIQSVAPSMGLDVRPINVHDPSEMERAVAAFAQSANGGMIVTASPLTAVHHNLIIALAARYRLPAVYPERLNVAGGGLISYGPNFTDEFRHAAGYVDRILKGEKPGGLPVQVPTKYELIINLKTAKALGLTVPPSLLATADEVLE
jgi:putative ABC transport system substrate-binding protein